MHHIKQLILPVLTAVIIAGCTSKEKAGCEFSTVHITSGKVGSNTLDEEYTIKDCFKRSKPDASGLIEVKGDKTSETFKTLYYNEPVGIKILTFKFKDISSNWRASKGHDISKIDKADTLSFTFSDPIESKIKGTVTFTK